MKLMVLNFHFLKGKIDNIIKTLKFFESNLGIKTNNSDLKNKHIKCKLKH